MNIRTVYRNAMRCYRLANKPGAFYNHPSAAIAAVALVRSITGVWDVPCRPRVVSVIRCGRAGSTPVESANFQVQPRYRHRDDGFGNPLDPVIYRPGKLQVNRSMTLFCRMTNRLAKERTC